MRLAFSLVLLAGVASLAIAQDPKAPDEIKEPEPRFGIGAKLKVYPQHSAKKTLASDSILNLSTRRSLPCFPLRGRSPSKVSSQLRTYLLTKNSLTRRTTDAGASASITTTPSLYCRE